MSPRRNRAINLRLLIFHSPLPILVSWALAAQASARFHVRQPGKESRQWPGLQSVSKFASDPPDDEAAECAGAEDGCRSFSDDRVRKAQQDADE